MYLHKYQLKFLKKNCKSFQSLKVGSALQLIFVISRNTEYKDVNMTKIENQQNICITKANYKLKAQNYTSS